MMNEGHDTNKLGLHEDKILVLYMRMNKIFKKLLTFN